MFKKVKKLLGFIFCLVLNVHYSGAKRLGEMIEVI